jgi:hypothetical protein
MLLLGLILARTFANPCLGREPKAKVVTYRMNCDQTLKFTTNNFWAFQIISRLQA